MNILKRLISPLFSSLLGLFVLNFFNVFDYINIAPPDLKNELALSSYILIFQVVLQYIHEYFYTHVCSKILLETYISNNIVKNPIFSLPDDSISVTEISFTLKINASIKLLKENSIKMIFPDWVHVQVIQGKTNTKYINNELIINLNSMILNDRKNIDYEEIIKIGIIRNNIDEKTSIDIVPNLYKRKYNLFLKFKSDTFILKGE